MNESWICDECESTNGGDREYCKSCGAIKSPKAKIINHTSEIVQHSMSSKRKETKSVNINEKKTKKEDFKVKDSRDVYTKSVTYAPDDRKEEKRLDELLKGKKEEKRLDELLKSRKEEKRLDELLKSKKEVTRGYGDEKRKEADNKRILHIILWIIYGIVDFMLLHKVEFFDTIPDIITGWIVVIGGAFGGVGIMDHLMEEWNFPYPFNVLVTASIGVFGAILSGIGTLIAMIIPWAIMTAFF